MRWYADLSDTDWDRGFDPTLRLRDAFLALVRLRRHCEPQTSNMIYHLFSPANVALVLVNLLATCRARTTGQTGGRIERIVMANTSENLASDECESSRDRFFGGGNDLSAATGRTGARGLSH
jgi:hypothetical protein